MSVSDGQLANQTNFNNAFMSRTSNDNTTGVKSLENADPASGANVTNPQRDINGLNSFSGRASNDVYNSLPNWAASEIGASTDNLKDRAEALTAAFTVATGHSHDGTAGSGGAISAADLTNLNYFKAQFQTAVFATGTGSSTDVSSSFTGESNSGSATSEGVITTPPFNRVQIILDSTEDAIEDANGRRVYGELTFSGGVWTLSYFVNIAGTPTAYTFTGSETIRIFYRKVYTLENVPTIGADVLVLPSMDATADIPDASATVRGLVSIGAQTIGGDKTFADDVNVDGQTRIATSITGVVKAASGVLSASNVNLASEVTGTLPVANGGTGLTALGSSNQILGVDNAGTAAEYKTVNGTVDQITVAHASNAINLSLPQNIATTSSPEFVNQLLTGVLKTQAATSAISGAGAELTLPSKFHVKLTNAALTSLAMIEDPTNDEQLLVLTNLTGNNIQILNLSGATTDHQIVTGEGADIQLNNTASLFLIYDRTQNKWIVIGGSGGSGGGGGANKTLSNLTSPTSINQNLISDATNTRNLGSVGNIWASGYIGTLRDSSDVSSVSVATRTLENNSGTTVFEWSGSNLDIKNRKIINANDPTAAQDVATKNYVDARAKLGNFLATSAPTVNDDSGGGYEVGSVWINTTTDRIYQCVDSSIGAAIWREIGVNESIRQQENRIPGVSLTTNTPANVTSTALTISSGTWDISGAVGFRPNANTSITGLSGAISRTSATLPANSVICSPNSNGEFQTNFGTPAIVPGSGNDISLIIPTYRVTVTGSTTFYLVGKASFTVSTIVGYGFIEARRVV